MSNDPGPNINPELEAALVKAAAAQKTAEDAALLAKSSAEQAAAYATKAAEDKIAAARDWERAVAIPEDQASELKTQRAAKKAAVWGMAIGGVITLGLLVIVYREQPMGLVLKQNIWTEIGATLGALLIVALIVERIVEILVSIWSSSKSDALLQQRDYHEKLQAKREKQISDLRKESCENPPPNESRQAEIVDALTTKRREAAEAERHAEIAEKGLVPYGARTRRLAAWSGLAIGVLAASVSIRLMESLVIINRTT